MGTHGVGSGTARATAAMSSLTHVLWWPQSRISVWRLQGVAAGPQARPMGCFCSHCHWDSESNGAPYLPPVGSRLLLLHILEDLYPHYVGEGDLKGSCLVPNTTSESSNQNHPPSQALAVLPLWASPLLGAGVQWSF